MTHAETGTPLRLVRVLLAAWCLAGLLVGGCDRGTPEQRLRASLDSLQRAIDAREAGAVADVLTDDFAGNDGLDREGARRLAALTFMRNRAVGATLGGVEVRLAGERRATVTFTALLTGGSGAWLPESGQVYRVRSGWREEDGKWRMASAEWTPQL